MKLPASVGQKKAKAIEQLVQELGIGEAAGQNTAGVGALFGTQ